jgi:hypothetical protein
MEAKNLRIGNLIKYIDKTIVCNVDIIYAVLKCIRQTKLYTPIEITEEWLRKLGFTRDDETDYRWYLLDKSIAYDADDNCIRIADSWEFGKRKYVHELQNLFFALTGTELELKDECST